MTARRFILGTLAGALTLFVWETLSNTVIPWHRATYRGFTDSTAVVQAVRANAPENGMYVDGRGVVAAVAFGPDMASRESLLGLMLGRQLALDLAVAAVVLVLLTSLPRMPVRQYAMTTAAAALAVSASVFGSDWNWYGFGTGWTLVNMVDRAIGYALVGLVMGALINKWTARTKTDEWGGVRASGSMASAKTTPRSAVKM